MTCYNKSLSDWGILTSTLSLADMLGILLLPSYAPLPFICHSPPSTSASIQGLLSQAWLLLGNVLTEALSISVCLQKLDLWRASPALHCAHLCRVPARVVQMAHIHSRSWRPEIGPVCVACQAPLSMGLSRQENWSGLPFPSPGDIPHPGIEPVSLVSPALAGGFFFPWKPQTDSSYM